jgi:uncharacterized membrane protein
MHRPRSQRRPFRMMSVAPWNASAVALVIAITVAMILVPKRTIAQSFYPIFIAPSPGLSNPVAVPAAIAPDGSRVGGSIVQYRTVVECAGIFCTPAFTWSPQSGLDLSEFATQIKLFDTPFGPRYTTGQRVVGITSTRALLNGLRGEPILFSADGPMPLRDESKSTSVLLTEGMSYDASVVVGNGGNPTGYGVARWTSATGFVPIDVGASFAWAAAISGDGQIIIGTSGPTFLSDSERAFRWSASGTTILGSLTPGGAIWPAAVSEDGAAIVGMAIGEPRDRAFRWTANGGTQALVLPAGFQQSAATAVTADGNVVVGNLTTTNDVEADFGTLDNSFNDLTAPKYRAMIWDAVHGTRLLQDVLVSDYALGNQLTGWTLLSASAISGNGNVIAGIGINPAGDFQGWVATIPEPSTWIMSLIGASMTFVARRLFLSHTVFSFPPK